MIVTIVNPSGEQIYRGRTLNPKVAALIAGGNIQVEKAPPDPNATWDGLAWQPGVAPVLDLAQTELRGEDIERLLLAGPPFTRAKINQAKRNRGKPLPS